MKLVRFSLPKILNVDFSTGIKVWSSDSKLLRDYSILNSVSVNELDHLNNFPNVHTFCTAKPIRCLACCFHCFIKKDNVVEISVVEGA